MENEKDKIVVIFQNIDYNLTYIDNYEKSFENCRETAKEHIEGIECAIRNTEHEIRQMKRENEIVKGIVYRDGILKEDCIDPLANDERIKYLEEYIDFLKEKKKGILKSTRELLRVEKYFLLETLGFFDLPEWDNITLSRDKELILAQLIGCDKDYTKNLLNRKHVISDNRKEEILIMIKEMKKGV